MNASRVLLLAAALAILGISPRAVSAQECRADELVDRILNQAAPPEPRADETTDAEIDSPTTAGTSTALADSPQKTNLFAIAMQQGLIDRTDTGAISISLAPFAWAESRAPDLFAENDAYERYARSRRLTGTVAFGGTGDALDSDGDGTPEEPAEAKELSDSIVLELQYRFYGTRDRREFPFQFRSALLRANERFNSRVGTADLTRAVGERVLALGDEGLSEEACDQIVADLGNHPDVRPLLEERDTLERVINAEIEAFDRSWVWSAALSAVEREEYLGGDKFGVSLRGLKGLEDDEFFKFNADYARVESLTGDNDDLRQVKLAAEYSRPVMSFLDDGEGPPRFSVALTAERYENAPPDVPDSVAKLGVRWSFPLARGVAIPVSLTWANHVALLSEEEEVIGHVGITLDFDSLLSAQR
jgi:hypothetical protein